MTKQAGPNPDHILQIGFGFWASKTLLSAVEMGVFTELADGPQELKSLAGRLGLHERSSRDFLDTLVALGFLKRNGTTYSNTDEADLFLDKQKPSYLGGILEMANARLFGFWSTSDGGAADGTAAERGEDGSDGAVRSRRCMQIRRG